MTKFFDVLITAFFKAAFYWSYRRKYKLDATFNFNGYFIRISGDGVILTGKNSYISFFSYINCSANTVVSIGDNVSIGHNVKIYTSTVDPRTLIVDKDPKNRYGDVFIGNNVLIGSNVFICPGVNIGDNVVIGANSVVSANIPSNCVAAGVPARVIKEY